MSEAANNCKSSCSVKLQRGLFDLNPRRTPAPDSTFDIFTNLMKTNGNFVKRINNFVYILPSSCFTEQL